MKCSTFRYLRRYLPCLGLIFASIPASAQNMPSKPINLDRELAQEIVPDRATSYYHFAIAKWNEEKGNLPEALSEMKIALDYSPGSAPIHLALAVLFEKSGNVPEAIARAQEAARLDPKDPDPHWLLANIYFQQGSTTKTNENLTKAVQELENLKELDPEDERPYAYLGQTYFRLNQPEKAIEAYEKYQTLASDTDKGYLEIAKYYESKGNDEKAIEYCLKGLNAQPDSTESLWHLSQLYSKTNKNKEAIPIYQRLLEATGDQPAIRPVIVQQLASTLIEDEKYDEAADLLKKQIEINPADKKAQILYGRVQIGQQRYPEAIETLQSVLNSSSSDSSEALEAQFYLAWAHERSGDFAEAIKIFSNLLDSEGAKANRTLFQQHLATDYEELGEYDKAIPLYEEIVKTEPRAVPGLINAYRSSRNYDKALSLSKQYFEKDPEDIVFGVYYARTLADTGKGKEGVEILSRLLQSHPKEIKIYMNIGAIYLQDKQYSEAEKVLLRARDHASENEEKEQLKFQLANVYEKQKDFDRAELMIKEILKDKPDNADALNYIGYMLADRGVRLDEAVQYVQKALSIEPRNGAYLDSLGWAFFKLNDLEKAKKYLLEAGGIIKNDPTIIDHIGDLYYKTGDYQKARDCWKKSMNFGTEKEEIEKVRRKLEKLKETLRRQKAK